MPVGLPDGINEALTVAPESVYSPILPPEPVPLFATNKSFPEIAIPYGLFNPEISEALLVAPVIAYSPMTL